MSDLTTGTVTFLFTDIEGSTRLWEQNPDAMSVALARHDALLRETIVAHGGRIFKTVGDAFCAAFATATEGVAAALSAQRALQSEAGQAAVCLKVRMALHTGAAEMRDNDYFGPPVNRVARLLAIGHGGQVLLSRATRSLLPADAPLLDHGSHRLKDLQYPEQVFQLAPADLPCDFPTLRSLALHAHNLPIQSTSFIGRERELREVPMLLTANRLLTLTGAGGCGKTRLALQMATEVLDDYPDGVWLVELAPLADPALIEQTVATTLGMREEPGRHLLETLTDHLRTKTLLLILDNCEHLVEACARLASAFLRFCPKVKLLATSREPLNVPGERPWHVPSLLPPDPERLPLEEKGISAIVGEYDAVRLFVDRASAQRSDFRLDGQNARTIAQLCHRLDGIPLALELAAARSRVLTVEQIAARLDDRFRLLTGGSRTLLPRQQTLRALIDWSYDLLNEQERTLLERLSVFARGWTLNAAERVAGDSWLVTDDWWSTNQSPTTNRQPPIAADDVLDLLTSLADKSLVIFEERDGEGRYRLLETVRAYAGERLAQSGDLEERRGRHLAHYMALAEEAEPQFRGQEQGRWLERLEAEHDNLRAALGWTNIKTPERESQDQSEIQNPESKITAAGLRLAGALWWFWYVRGYLTEGRAHLETLFSQPGGHGKNKEHGNARNGAGSLAWRQGDYVAARSYYEESLAIRRELDDKPGIAASLNGLGIVAHDQGDYATARLRYEESLAIRREIGDRQGVAVALGNLGSAVSSQGDYAAARAIQEESLAIRRELGDKQGIAAVLNNLGDDAHDRGDYAVARLLFEESLTIRQELGDQIGIALALGNLGSIAFNQRDYATARSLQEESLTMRRKLGDRQGIAYSLFSLGNVANKQYDYSAAHAYYVESLTISSDLGDKPGIAASLEAFADLHSAQAQGERAARLWAAVEALRAAIAFPRAPHEIDDYNIRVASARAILGEEAFANAWTEGSAMTLEQAITYALDNGESGTLKD